MNYELKYIKYKTKYLEQEGGKKKSKKKLNKNIFNNVNKNMNSIKPNYTETLSEPWFSLILLGLKTVEGRKNKGRFKDMKVGDIVEWTNDDFMSRSVLTKITGKAEYPTFKEYLEKEGLDKCLPGMEKFGIDHGLSVYYKYYTKEDEKEFGVVAIKIALL
jgi:ASC-1-like (ASCH) protein